MRDVARYVITTHRRLDGVRLSKRGNWGNIPFPDDEAAATAARADAGGGAIEIERVRK